MNIKISMQFHGVAGVVEAMGGPGLIDNAIVSFAFSYFWGGVGSVGCSKIMKIKSISAQFHGLRGGVMGLEEYAAPESLKKFCLLTCL